MPSLNIYVEKNIDKCEKIWKYFSADTHLFDNWNYREYFHNAYHNRPYFIVGSVGKTLSGCIPLEYDSREKEYRYFGDADGWNERNLFFIKNAGDKKSIFEKLFSQLPKKTVLRFVPQQKNIDLSSFSEEEELGFHLEPKKFSHVLSDYMNTFSKLGKRNLRRVIRNIENAQYRVKLNNYSDMKWMIDTNLKRYGDDSSFIDAVLKESFLGLHKNKLISSFFSLVTVYHKDDIASVSLYGKYKKSFVYLTGSTNYEYRDAGRYIDYLVIKTAFETKSDYIDLLSGECGWKNHWRMESEKLFKLP